MSFSYFKVIGVMGWCDFYTACSKFFVYIFICHNRNFSVRKRQLQHFSYQVFVSFIFRIHCYRSISQKSFRTCGRDFHKFAFFSHYRIINMPEKSVLVFMFYLCVRNRSLAHRTPVDNSGALINIAFFIQLNKDFLHSF